MLLGDNGHIPISVIYGSAVLRGVVTEQLSHFFREYHYLQVSSTTAGSREYCHGG